MNDNNHDAAEPAPGLLDLPPTKTFRLTKLKRRRKTPDITRGLDDISCICGFSYDDGFSIVCNDCSRWCHAACFNIMEGEVPEEFRCWECVSRPADKERAMKLRKTKLGQVGEQAELDRAKRRASPGIERKPLRAANPDVQQSNAIFQNARDFSISGNFVNTIVDNYRGTDDLESLKRFVSFDDQFDLDQSNNTHLQNSDSTTANTGTSESHTQVQIHADASHDQSSSTSESAGTPDVMQGSTFFRDAHGVKIGGNPHFTNIGSLWRTGLESLERSVSFDALNSSVQDPERICHPGTRQNVLKRLGDWVDNPNAKERIFWLYGPAGAGKSVIAQTIAHSYDRPTVAATFFFFRSDPKRNDGNRLFTTLAYQLAFSMPKIKDHIVHALSERPDLPRTPIETQFNQLISRPFHLLTEDTAQQSAPTVGVIGEMPKKYQELAPVIVIDGVDECRDEKLQQRLLKVIGSAVADDSFPLRFLIVSRSELHIEHTIRRFQTPILTIDLGDLDDANRDIEKYLEDKFSEIASEQGLDPAWPGQKRIDDIIYKSSGKFIFASLVIKFVGDPYYFAKTQLEIVLNMKLPMEMSPFAVLDQLFLEILRRAPDQDFLKRYLALLTARISISESYSDMYKDDAVLMHVSEQELHANLRGMRSLLKFEPGIDIHHKSFLDFLHDSARSGHYYIRNQNGIRGYLGVFVDSLVRYASAVIEQPNHHNAPHFTPRFGELINRNPQAINLGIRDWEEILRPLLDLMGKLLRMPNIDSFARDCDECRVFHIIYDILTHSKSREREDPDVERYLELLEEIISSDNKTSADVAEENIPDELYLETLNRVPDQDFLKTFLGLLVGRCSITLRDGLSKDDAMLMDISRDGLGERLHEMHSILRFEPSIDVHHRSFLDFLQDSSLSGQYHVDRSAGTRQYLELITKVLIRHCRLTNHGNDHFAPEFGKLIKRNPQEIELDVEDWEQTLRPLLNALDKLLVPSNIDSLMDSYCQQCQFFQITYDTLTHFKSLRNSDDPLVEKCLKSLEEIILYGNPRHQNFDTNFRPVVFGSVAVAGILMVILAHQR